MPKKKVKNKKNYYQELLAELYFVEGLEDIRFLYYLKRESLENFCKSKGEKICQIIFALIRGENPKNILNKLNK